MAGTGTPEPVPAQLAAVLAPAAHQADGSYQVSIRLQPEDLGVVHVELRLEGGTVNVSMHADGDATRDMLRQNLGQLRQQLADSGLTTGHFDVSGGSDSHWSPGQQQNANPVDELGEERSDPAAEAGAPERAGISSLPNGQLDVRL
jgi:flagellar hook-length control protein FliK